MADVYIWLYAKKMAFRLSVSTRIKWLATCLVLVAAQARAAVFINPAEAFRESARLRRPVLLIFSGSDWCVPCIQFQKKVLDDSGFQRYAADNLVLLEADFPQRRRIPDSLAAAYDALAAKYNASGAFPKLLLLGGDGAVIAETPWQHGPAADFIRLLQGLAKNYAPR